jgi:D-lactate dehydrogenase
MKVLIYSARDFEIPYLEAANKNRHQLEFTNESMCSKTAMKAVGYDAVCIFSADEACFLTIEKLKDFNVKYITLRSVGYDNVNLRAAERLGIKVANIPAYSPHAIAEHAVSLLLNINRRIIESNRRFKRFNFKLDGLIGMDLHQKTVGLVGTGKIGSVMAKIMYGFGCKLLGYDLEKDEELETNFGLEYCSLEQLCEQSHIISIHVPLNAETHYLINDELFYMMRSDVIIINTARGAIINTEHLIEALKENRIGAYGSDVYENEKGVFFKDLSQQIPDDLNLIQLNALPNVLLTGHHAYLTEEALTNIADQTFQNLDKWAAGEPCPNELTQHETN